MLVSGSALGGVSSSSLPLRSLSPASVCTSGTASGFPHHHHHRNSPGAIGSRARLAVITATSVLDRSSTISIPTTGNGSSSSHTSAPEHTFNQIVREGHYESELVALQAGKRDKEQPSIAAVLTAADPTKLADVVVVGAGPSGLCLAAELAKRGVERSNSHDRPIVNNYGVWLDEFEALGLLHTLDCSWPDAVCYFGEGQEVSVDWLVTLAAGAAAGKFLSYEEDAPVVASQTAYGIEAEVEGYDAAYPGGLMLFMDFRRHHTGMYEGTGAELQAGTHPNAGDGLWGTAHEAPSFLYAMPLGGNRVFLEETCLVAKPALPFAVLKRRLERRLKAMGIRVKESADAGRPDVAAAAKLNILVAGKPSAVERVRPLLEAMSAKLWPLGDAPERANVVKIAGNFMLATAIESMAEASALKATFHVFGMELLATLDLQTINSFFGAFFRLPAFYWRGFLASQLTAAQLISFALIMFVIAGVDIKTRLVMHLLSDPAGGYLINAYKNQIQAATASSSSSSSSSTAGSVATVALLTACVSKELETHV
ncbi:MAG: hypothetical protein WDW38_000016 [Sanguina aurantia]